MTEPELIKRWQAHVDQTGHVSHGGDGKPLFEVGYGKKHLPVHIYCRYCGWRIQNDGDAGRANDKSRKSIA